jgi:hypothetical protein
MASICSRALANFADNSIQAGWGQCSHRWGVTFHSQARLFRIYIAGYKSRMNRIKAEGTKIIPRLCR